MCINSILQCAIRHLFHAATLSLSLAKCSGFAILLFSFLRFWNFILAPALVFPYTQLAQSCLLPRRCLKSAYALRFSQSLFRYEKLPTKPISDLQRCPKLPKHHAEDPLNGGQIWPLVKSDPAFALNYAWLSALFNPISIYKSEWCGTKSQALQLWHEFWSYNKYE
jgi:hypothetical protein